jgi:hypothetical protein
VAAVKSFCRISRSAKRNSEMGKINKKEFEVLTKTEQVIMLFREGEEVADRIEDDFDIHLFKLPGLFVELWYPSKTRKIVKVRIVNPDKIKKDYKDLKKLDIV